LSDLEHATITEPPVETLTAIAVAAQGIMHRNKDFMKVLFSEAMSEDAIATDEYRIVTERWRNAQVRIVREFIDKGELPASIDVDFAARQLVVLSVGPFIDAIMSGQDQNGAEPPRELVERVRAGVERFVAGLQA
jgi:hypothetical protein